MNVNLIRRELYQTFRVWLKDMQAALRIESSLQISFQLNYIKRLHQV